VKPDLALTRRSLLGLLGTKALLLGIGASGAATLACGPEPDPRALDGVLAALAAGRTLGRSYLAEHPGEQSEAALRSALLPEPEALWTPLPQAALASRLLTQMDRDFEHGQVVRVEGWVLSQVEARLFALVALRAPQDEDPNDAAALR
jgi:hypothetical protein